MDATITFDADLFLWKEDGSWVFAGVPAEVAEEIRDMPLPRGGFGSVKVTVRTGSSEWSTSLFPDSEANSFVLPVKKSIRTAEGIEAGDTATFEIDLVFG